MAISELEELEMRERLESQDLGEMEELEIREALEGDQISQPDIDANKFLRQNAPGGNRNPNFGRTGIGEVPEGFTAGGENRFAPPGKLRQELGQSPVMEVPVDKQGKPITSIEGFLSDTKQFGESLKNESLPVGGAIVGGILGGPGGAALGAAGGEGFKQVLQNFGYFGGNAPKTSGEAIKEMGIEGAIGGTGEGIARALVGAGSKAGRGFSKAVSREGDEALRFFKGSGITLNPAKLTDSRILDVASNAGEASFISGNKFLNGQLQAAHFIDDSVDDLVRAMRASDRQLAGDLVQDAISKNTLAFKERSVQLYKNLDDIVEGAVVDIRPLKAEAYRLLQESEAAVGAGTRKSLLREIIRKGDSMTFSDAHTLRASLLTRGRMGTDPLADQTVGIAKKLSGEIDDLMTNAIGQRPGAKEAFRAASNFWKKGKELFNNTLIKKLVKEDASQVSKKIFEAASDNPDMIRRIRKAIGGDTATWRALQGEVMDKIIKSASDPKMFESSGGSDIISKTLLSRLRKFGGQDEAALRAMFPARQDRVLSKLARIKGLILKGQPDSTGRFAVQIGQIAALASVASGKFGRRAGAILLGPEAIARAFQKPSIVRFITEGANINPKTASGLKQLTLFTTRLAVLLNKEEIKHEVIEPVLQDSFGAGFIDQPNPKITNFGPRRHNAIR